MATDPCDVACQTYPKRDVKNGGKSYYVFLRTKSQILQDFFSVPKSGTKFLWPFSNNSAIPTMALVTLLEGQPRPILTDRMTSTLR
jgi:hypothetical protein